MSAPRGTASPTFDDCVQWYVEATRTSDKQWVADCAVAAWGQAYALAVAKVALEQTVAASGAGAGAGPVADTPHAREQARANALAETAQRRAADRADGQERPVLTVHPKISQRNPETNTVTIKNASMREELVNELGTLDQQLGWVSQVCEAPRQQIKLINSK